MSTVHHVPILSYCETKNGVTELHQFKKTYEFDGFIPVKSSKHADEPRWLILLVCKKCNGSYTSGLTYKNPKEKEKS